MGGWSQALDGRTTGYGNGPAAGSSEGSTAGSSDGSSAGVSAGSVAGLASCGLALVVRLAGWANGTGMWILMKPRSMSKPLSPGGTGKLGDDGQSPVGTPRPGTWATGGWLAGPPGGTGPAPGPPGRGPIGLMMTMPVWPPGTPGRPGWLPVPLVPPDPPGPVPGGAAGTESPPAALTHGGTGDEREVQLRSAEADQDGARAGRDRRQPGDARERPTSGQRAATDGARRQPIRCPRHDISPLQPRSAAVGTAVGAPSPAYKTDRTDCFASPAPRERFERTVRSAEATSPG